MKTSGKKWAKYIDQSIKAKRSGWRKSSVTGERYYEARPDHSDSNPKERYADGGELPVKNSKMVGKTIIVQLPTEVKPFRDKVIEEYSDFVMGNKGFWSKKYIVKKSQDGGMMAKGGNTDDTPKIYVADLNAYNNGRLIGEWVDLSEFDNGEEVMEKLGEIVNTWKEKYGDDHEEWAIHDYENFSSSLYSEYMGEDDFNKVIQVYKVSEDKGIPANVLGDIMREYEPDDLEEWIDEHYEGQFDSDTDLAYHYVDVLGGIDQLGEETLQNYFDYESFGRDLAYDYSEYDGHYFRSYARGGTMGKSYDLKKYVFNTGFNYSIGGL